MRKRLLSRSSLVLVILCLMVFAQKPMRLLVQGFASTIIETVEKADEAKASPIVSAVAPVVASPPVLLPTTLPVAGVVARHTPSRSVLRI